MMECCFDRPLLLKFSGTVASSNPRGPVKTLGIFIVRDWLVFGRVENSNVRLLIGHSRPGIETVLKVHEFALYSCSGVGGPPRGFFWSRCISYDEWAVATYSRFFSSSSFICFHYLLYVLLSRLFLLPLLACTVYYYIHLYLLLLPRSPLYCLMLAW